MHYKRCEEEGGGCDPEGRMPEGKGRGKVPSADLNGRHRGE